MIARTLFLLGSAISVASATPVFTRAADDDAATVYFTPYAVVGCRMSENPYSGLLPTSYNVTTGSGCVTSSYVFQSYVESANSIATGGPCSFSIYPGADCTGSFSAVTLTTYGECVADSITAQSFLLACGP